jgi:hypothetical protein
MKEAVSFDEKLVKCGFSTHCVRSNDRVICLNDKKFVISTERSEWRNLSNVVLDYARTVVLLFLLFERVLTSREASFPYSSSERSESRSIPLSLQQEKSMPLIRSLNYARTIILGGVRFSTHCVRSNDSTAILTLRASYSLLRKIC